MKTKILMAALLCVLFASCKKALDEQPQGVISSADLNTPANVDAMVIAAYSALGNDYWAAPYSSMWAYGSIRSGDAYKGGDGPGDVPDFHAYETFSLNRVDIGTTDNTWYRLYVGIGRVNDALGRVEHMPTSTYPQKIQREAECRFLRGHFYFLLKILYNHVPWIDETIPKASYDTVSNVGYTSTALWSKIANDFKFAAANLPASQTQVGRPTKEAAQAYLAKTLLYAAYKQDNSNNVTGVDPTLISEVNTLCDSVINSGKYNLEPDFANNFLTADENGPESVFAIQYSINDGTPDGRVDNGHSLDYPMNASFGCCGFHVPSHNLINAFQTDANGLPLFNTFNNNDVEQSNSYTTSTFDPRIDHTAAIPGHPYKYEPADVYQNSWARDPAVYGYLLSMKETVAPDDPSFKKFPPFMSSSKNWAIIRYSDVLLMKAEALIQMGDETQALPLINAVRQRAMNSTTLLKQSDGTATSNYHMDIYRPGVNCTWTNAYAMQALMFERRLEFAMEGYRFFDLVRWGIAANYLNTYFSVEKTRVGQLQSAQFTKNRDEYMPIPQNQINFSKGLYKQNPGW